jgi:hypothetical protein
MKQGLLGHQQIRLEIYQSRPPLAFAPVPALPPFLLSQESTGVQARKRGGERAEGNLVPGELVLDSDRGTGMRISDL